jgi:hypothetical protein
MRITMRTVVCAITAAISLQAAEVIHFRDEGAEAFFTASNGCVVTSYQVTATNGRSHSPSNPVQMQTTAFVAINRFDVCTQIPLMSAWGAAPLSSSEFQLAQNLSSASLHVSVPMQDGLSGQTFTAEIALTWTATDEMTHGISITHTSAPGMRVNGRSHGSSRVAAVSGSIVVGNTPVVLGSPLFAAIRKSTSGTVIIH